MKKEETIYIISRKDLLRLFKTLHRSGQDGLSLKTVIKHWDKVID